MMEWEEHLREMAQTAEERPGYKMLVWFTARDAVAEIDRLRSEITSLTAEIAEKDAEIERGKTYKKAHSEECKMMFAEIGAKLQAAESLAASRLADQEGIERHTRRVVAEEIVDIMNHKETFQDVKAVIWQKYGVE